MAIKRVAIVGLGLIGSSIARAVAKRLPEVAVTGHDASDEVREKARELGLCDTIADDPAAAAADADFVILAVPVGRMADAAGAIAPGLKAGAITLRCAVCTGGSAAMKLGRFDCGGGSAMTILPFSHDEEKVAGSSSTACTSACVAIDQ